MNAICQYYTVMTVPEHSPLQWIPDSAMTLAQAVDRANALLAASGRPQPDGRVRPALDGRTIRYYQTLGIVPPPRRAGGRRAMYRSTHLVRAVMTKLLQIQGARLTEVAAELSQQSDAHLWNEVGAMLQGELRTDADARGTAWPARRAGARLAMPSAIGTTDRVPPAAASPDHAARSQPQPVALTLAPGAHLMLEPHATRDPDELTQMLRRALAALPPAATPPSSVRPIGPSTLSAQ